jgi:hypothetical protein
VRRTLLLLAFDQLDRTVDQVGVEVLTLLLRQLDVLERRGDLVTGQKPLLHAIGDESRQLLGIEVSRPELNTERGWASSAPARPLRNRKP